MPPKAKIDTFVGQYGPSGETPMVHPASWGRGAEVLSSGLLTFDVLTGVGGFTYGTVNSISGASKAGKSTLMYRLSANAIAHGDRVFYADTERGYGPEIAEANGLPMEDDMADEDRHFWLAQYEPVDPDDEDAESRIEGTLRDIRRAVKSFMIDCGKRQQRPIIIIDSLNFATPMKTAEKKPKKAGDSQDSQSAAKVSDNQGGIAVAARMINEWMPELLGYVGKYKGIVVFVVQFRANINTGPAGGMAPQYRVSEPYAMKYGPKIKAKFVYVGKIQASPTAAEAGFERAGDEIQITIEKNRGGINYRQGIYRLLADRGPDDIYEVIFYGQMTGLVAKAGAFYKFQVGIDERLEPVWTPSIQGQEKCWDYFYSSEENLLQLARLKQEIRERLLLLPAPRAVGKGEPDASNPAG